MEIIDVYQYIKYIEPELLILLAFLIGIGKIIKKSVINNKHIPLILLTVSVVVSFAWLFIMEREVFSRAIVRGIVQGGIISAVAVFGNQVVKQYKKDK